MPYLGTHSLSDEMDSLPFATSSYFTRVVALAFCAIFFIGCSCEREPHQADSVSGTGSGASNGGDGDNSAGAANGGGPSWTSDASGGGSARSFVHPGLLHTDEDFERMRSKVSAGADPWASTWQTLVNYEDTALDQTPQPVEVLVRGGEDENFLILIDDLRAMYGLALAWKITEDEEYADLVVTFLDAWASTLTEVSGNTDRYLASGLYGYQLANVGEIMRDYPGWTAAGRERFRAMLLEAFYPLQSEWLRNHDGSCSSHFWANWDMANLAGMLAVGVFADRGDIYEEALEYLHSGVGNGALENMVFFLHPAKMGQYQESGRDQGHSNLGVTLMGVIAKQAWNQGDDLFAWEEHRLLSAFEYIARYNVGQEVPYVPYGPNCADAYQEVVSEAGRGHKRRSWLLPLNHYRNRLGIAVPWMEAKHEDVGEEVWRWSNDELGWGSLTESLEPLTRGGAPLGLEGRLRGEATVLSFWGSVGAVEYTLQRAVSEGGSYETVATLSANEDLTFTDTDVVRDMIYSYRVRANFEDGEASPWSQSIRISVGPELLLNLSFDEAEGDSVPNLATEEPGAQLHEGARLGEGRNGQALVLDGQSAYATIELDVVRDLSDFTVSAWVQLSEPSAFARVFDFGANDHRYVAFSPNTDGIYSRFMMSKISYFADETVDGPALSTGDWTHVTVTLSANVAILYLDGVEVGRNEEIVFSPAQLGLSGSQAAGYLGRSHYEADPRLSGRLDDFRVYAGALSSDEVVSLAQQ